MANGRLVSHTTGASEETWRWSEDDPMASYLATATNGVFETASRPARCDQAERLLCSYTTDLGCRCTTRWIRTPGRCCPIQ
jgi:hypothetical protein